MWILPLGLRPGTLPRMPVPPPSAPSLSPVAVATITIAARDAPRLARFWRDVLGYAVAPNHSSSVLLCDPADVGPALLIQPRDRFAAPEAGHLIHLDLRPDDQAATVARALTLGATHLDIGQAGDEGWVVLADPEGHAFCVLESRAAHGVRDATNPGTPTCID